SAPSGSTSTPRPIRPSSRVASTRWTSRATGCARSWSDPAPRDRGVNADPHLFEQPVGRLRDAIGAALLGNPVVVDLALTAVLAGGHLLLHDVHGVGKTTLAA